MYSLPFTIFECKYSPWHRHCWFTVGFAHTRDIQMFDFFIWRKLKGLETETVYLYFKEGCETVCVTSVTTGLQNKCNFPVPNLDFDIIHCKIASLTYQENHYLTYLHASNINISYLVCRCSWVARKIIFSLDYIGLFFGKWTVFIGPLKTHKYLKTL